tara:strand:- start:127 stop:324 length:198 start_codon:yes stop_codon:yes gene_type:complete
MEKQIIPCLIAVVLGLAGWNLKQTHDLSIKVANVQVQQTDREVLEDMRMSIQRLELLLLEDAMRN